MKVGVISDTHARNLDGVPQPVLAALAEVDLIVHAGDFTEKAVLDGLNRLAEVKAVCGNMDSGELRRILPEKERFSFGGKRFGVVHGWGGPRGIADRVGQLFGDVDVIIFGHSHEPYNRYSGGSLLFNPGMARRSYGLLTIDGEVRAEVIEL